MQKVGERWPRMNLPLSVSCLPAVVQSLPMVWSGLSAVGFPETSLTLTAYLLVLSLQEAAGFLTNTRIHLAYIKRESGN